MTERIVVAVTARLHLGFLDLNGSLGRRFGSIGLALDRPVTRIALSRAARIEVCGAERERAAAYLDAAMRHIGIRGGHHLAIEAAMPAHAGLGSGTQLALAVASALRRLHGRPADPRDDAAWLGRGARSGVGIGLFRRGGFVIDGGHGAATTLPPVLARLAVPAEWRVLLVMDPLRQGLSGVREKAAFAALPPLSDAHAGRVCRLVLMQMLPALAEADLPGFGAALTEIQHILGDHFAPAQGGRFSSPRVAGAMEWLAQAGATGIGQSSWGPTGFAFVQGATAARDLAARLASIPAGEGLDIVACRALNRGAAIAAR